MRTEHRSASALHEMGSHPFLHMDSSARFLFPGSNSRRRYSAPARFSISYPPITPSLKSVQGLDCRICDLLALVVADAEARGEVVPVLSEQEVTGHQLGGCVAVPLGYRPDLSHCAMTYISRFRRSAFSLGDLSSAFAFSSDSALHM